MLLAHALTLAQARSYLAALADRARSIEASSNYEHVLIELDRLHSDQGPALDTRATYEPARLYSAAVAAVQELPAHGVDNLQVELLLAMLEDAHAQDRG